MTEKDLRDLPPITVHQVRLVEFDFEKEGGPRRVGGDIAFRSVRGIDDLGTDDETFEGFTFPFARQGYIVSEFPDLLDGVEHSGLGLDEAPFVCELVNNAGGLGAETFRVLVETVEVEPRFFGRVREDVFFEVIVT